MAWCSVKLWTHLGSEEGNKKYGGIKQSSYGTPFRTQQDQERAIYFI